MGEARANGRRRWVARLVVRAALAAAVVTASPAAASCAPPLVTLDEERVAAGSEVHVVGEGFADGCNDTPSTGFCSSGDEEEVPLRGVVVELRRRGEVLGAVTVDADETFRFRASLAVPSDARSGRYSVVCSLGGQTRDSVPVTVVPRK